MKRGPDARTSSRQSSPVKRKLARHERAAEAMDSSLQHVARPAALADLPGHQTIAGKPGRCHIFALACKGGRCASRPSSIRAAKGGIADFQPHTADVPEAEVLASF